MTLDSTVKSAAIQALAAGLRPIPIRADGSKAPAVRRWGQFQQRPPTKAEVDYWFREDESVGLGLVMGNGYECLDFDDHAAWESYQDAAKACGLEPLLQRAALVYLELTPRGWHLVWRAGEHVTGNQKLARVELEDGSMKAVIETRGRGGYIIAAPSAGKVHESGGAYEMLAGGVGSVEEVSKEEREALLDLARSMNQVTPPAPAPMTFSGTSDGLKPGEDFEQQTSWAEILEPHGWRRLYKRHDETFWRRPGKSSGQSATTNYGESGLLWVFTSSTAFAPEKSYTRFGAFAVLEHGGDYEAAARDLRARGYGGESGTVELPPDVDLTGILAAGIAKGSDKRNDAPEPANDNATAVVKVDEEDGQDPGPFPAHLLELPGLLGELHAYTVAAAPKPQPILALGSALATLGAVMGRRVQGAYGTRTNLYALGLAENGAGKAATRALPRRALGAAGMGKLASYDDMASDAAITTALTETPSCVFMLDEVGVTLRAMASPRAPAHIAHQVAVYLKLYGASGGTYYGKTYAAREGARVEQPCLCLWGTSVPSKVFDSMTSEQVNDGFLSRLLVFESDDPDPLFRRVPVDRAAPPSGLVTKLRRWAELDGLAGSLPADSVPEPRVVPISAEAEAIFDALADEMRTRRAALRARGDEGGLWTRVDPAAAKLALIRACGRSITSPVVDAGDARWGVDLARYLVERFAWRVSTSVADTEHEQNQNVILETLRRAGGGEQRWKLRRRLRKIDKRAFDDALETLKTAGMLAIVKASTEGRPRTLCMTREAFLARGGDVELLGA